MRTIRSISLYITGRNVAQISRDTGIAMQTIKKVQGGSNRVMHYVIQSLDEWIDHDINKSRGI
ncbi:MAG: hypothetical protein ABGY11_07730 [Candidatus Thioglobus sp.]